MVEASGAADQIKILGTKYLMAGRSTGTSTTGSESPSMSAKKKTLAVIGCGPGGIALATQCAAERSLDVSIFECGRAPRSRICPVDHGDVCNGCRGICNVISGIGGSIHYGDSIKLSGFPSGRRLHAHLGEERYFALESQALRIFGAEAAEFVTGKQEKHFGLAVRQYPVIELSERRLGAWLSGISRELEPSLNLHSRVTNIDKSGARYLLTITGPERRGKKTARIESFDFVALATGRAGHNFTSTVCEQLNIETAEPNLSVGIRIELPARYLTPMYQAHRDFKFSQRFEGLKVKSFCFSSAGERGGKIKFCHYQQEFSHPVVFLDGHSYIHDAICESSVESLGNLALLVQLPKKYTPSWVNDTFVPQYFKYSNGKPICQSASEFLQKAPSLASKPASVVDIKFGDVTALFPELANTALRLALKQFIQSISLASETDEKDVEDSALVLGPELEFFWPTVTVDKHFCTSSDGLYVIGDAAGIAQGNLQAAISGIAAADGIMARL